MTFPIYGKNIKKKNMFQSPPTSGKRPLKKAAFVWIPRYLKTIHFLRLCLASEPGIFRGISLVGQQSGSRHLLLVVPTELPLAPVVHAWPPQPAFQAVQGALISLGKVWDFLWNYHESMNHDISIYPYNSLSLSHYILQLTKPRNT